MGAGPEEAKMVHEEGLLLWGMHSRSQGGNHEGEMSNLEKDRLVRERAQHTPMKDWERYWSV